MRRSNSNMKKVCILTSIILCQFALGKDQVINYYGAFEIQHKDRSLGIDACDLNPYSEKEEKESNPLKRPEKLYLLTDKGSLELKFTGMKRIEYKVCDSNKPRNLWIWKNKEEIKNIPLIVDNPNLKFKTFKDEFKKYVLTDKDWEKLTSLNGRKQWSGNGNKECSAYSAKEFIRLECGYIVYLFRNHKLVLEHSDPDNYSVTLNLVGELINNSETYYFITFYNDPSRPIQGDHPSVLKSSSGKEIYPAGCSLPTKC